MFGKTLSAGAAEYTSLQENKTPWLWHQRISLWASSNTGAFGDVEYPFIAITPRSTLAQSRSTW